jgi:hypothetical protein
MYHNKSKKTNQNYKKTFIEINKCLITRNLRIGVNISPKPNASPQNLNLNTFIGVQKINHIRCRCQFSFPTENRKRVSESMPRTSIYKEKHNRHFSRVDSQ